MLSVRWTSAAGRQKYHFLRDSLGCILISFTDGIWRSRTVAPTSKPSPVALQHQDISTRMKVLLQPDLFFWKDRDQWATYSKWARQGAGKEMNPQQEGESKGFFRNTQQPYFQVLEKADPFQFCSYHFCATCGHFQFLATNSYFNSTFASWLPTQDSNLGLNLLHILFFPSIECFCY